MESDGKTIERDSDILADEPGKRIAWRSIGGDSDNAGEVIFDEAPGDRGTMVIDHARSTCSRDPFGVWLLIQC
jgi:uncharacterized membrane protein